MINVLWIEFFGDRNKCRLVLPYPKREDASRPPDLSQRKVEMTKRVEI